MSSNSPYTQKIGWFEYSGDKVFVMLNNYSFNRGDDTREIAFLIREGKGANQVLSVWEPLERKLFEAIYERRYPDRDISLDLLLQDRGSFEMVREWIENGVIYDIST